MENHQVGPALKKGRREDEAESSNARTRARIDEDVIDHHHHRLMLQQVKQFSSFGMDSRSLRKIIKIHEVKAFKRTLSKVESISCYEVFRGFDDVNFYKTLYEYLRPWKDKVVERRREGKVSLLDSVSMVDLSNQQGKIALYSFEQTVMELGSQLSEIIVSYLLMFMDWDEGEVQMRGRCNELEATIRCEILEEEEGNFFTKKILCLIKYFLEKIIEDKRGKSVDNVLYEERDRFFLGSIFNMVLLMVIGLSCPFFSSKLENEDIMELGDFLTFRLEKKMSDLNLMVDQDHQELLVTECSEEVVEKKEMLIRILDKKIKRLWR